MGTSGERGRTLGSLPAIQGRAGSVPAQEQQLEGKGGKGGSSFCRVFSVRLFLTFHHPFHLLHLRYGSGGVKKTPASSSSSDTQGFLHLVTWPPISFLGARVSLIPSGKAAASIAWGGWGYSPSRTSTWGWGHPGSQQEPRDQARGDLLKY